jgi:selenocysteine lyase/cysteine desulfurase
VERRANAAGISLRTGCFCNPGGGEVALGLSATELSACFVRSPDRLAIDDFRRCIDDKSTGAVRVSLGIVSTFADVHRFVEFVAGFADEVAGAE